MDTHTKEGNEEKAVHTDSSAYVEPGEHRQDESEKRVIHWGPIITDMLILMGVMGVLGFLSNLVMVAFETTTPTDSLVSLIRKEDVKNGQDAPYARELENVLKQNPDFINTRDNTGRTPLMWTVYVNYNDPAETQKKDGKRLFYLNSLLSTPGIQVNERDNDGFTALHWAAWSGMPACVERLVQAGVDVDASENSGYTPLMLAAMRGNAETVQTLLRLGADPARMRHNGDTATSLAKTHAEAYHKRSSFVYTLLYSEHRDNAYKKVCKVLDGAGAGAVK